MLVDYCEASEVFHTKWKNNCIYVFPLSLISWLIPGLLNAPFYWNLFRFYSNWSAALSAAVLKANLTNSKLPHASVHPVGITFKSSDKLDDIVKKQLRDETALLSKEQVEDIAEEYHLGDEVEESINESISFITFPPNWNITAQDLSSYWNNIKNRHRHLKKE